MLHLVEPFQQHVLRRPVVAHELACVVFELLKAVGHGALEPVQHRRHDGLQLNVRLLLLPARLPEVLEVLGQVRSALQPLLQVTRFIQGLHNASAAGAGLGGNRRHFPADRHRVQRGSPEAVHHLTKQSRPMPCRSVLWPCAIIRSSHRHLDVSGGPLVIVPWVRSVPLQHQPPQAELPCGPMHLVVIRELMQRLNHAGGGGGVVAIRAGDVCWSALPGGGGGRPVSLRPAHGLSVEEEGGGGCGKKFLGTTYSFFCAANPRRVGGGGGYTNFFLTHMTKRFTKQSRFKAKIVHVDLLTPSLHQYIAPIQRLHFAQRQ